jgi:hypothetical protein
MRSVSSFISFFLALAVFSALSNSASACDLEYLGVKAIQNRPLLAWDDVKISSTGATIKAAVAINSYVSASFAVRTPDHDCSNVSFHATDFENTVKAGQILPAKNIHISYVKKWFQAGSAWTGIDPHGPRKLVPELLLQDPDLIKVDLINQRNYLKITQSGKEIYKDVSIENIHVTNGSLIPPIEELNVRDSDHLLPATLNSDPQQMWITINTDASTQPGSYTGNIVLQKDASQILTIPVTITVFSFSLPAPKLEYSIFYRGQLFAQGGTISSEYKNEEQYVAELNDMKRHGISNPTTYQDPGNILLFKKALQLRHDAGFTDKKLYYLGISAASATSPLSADKLKNQIFQLKNAAGSFNYSDIYICGIDEAKGEVQLSQLSSWAVVKQAGAYVFTTGQAGTYQNVGKFLDMLTLAYQPDPSEVQKFHSVNKRVLTYAFPQTGPEDPELFRRNYGVKLWMAGVDGAMPYAYMHSFGSSWNDFDAEYRDHHFVYPTANGVIDTIAWEGFHEGIEDVRYLTALEQKISKYDNSQCHTNLNCQTSFNAAKVFFAETQAGKHLEDLDALRSAIAQLLANLELDAHVPPSAPSPISVDSAQKK